MKKRWSWKWLDERLENIGPIKHKIGDCIKKIDVPGTAWCMWCEHKISFANKGKKHFMQYCVTDKHLETLKVRVVTVGVVVP